MTTKVTKLAGLLAVAPVLLLASGCVPVGELQIESKAVELGEAEAVDVEIKMGAGKLTVAGGARELLEADFVYNLPAWKPQVDYYVSGRRGRLTVRQPPSARVRGIHLGDVRYEWDLRLKDDVPMELRVDLGAGKSDLELGRLSLTTLDIRTGAGKATVDLADSQTLTRLDLDMGAGEVTLDLTGDWKTDLDARIKGGVGRTTLRLPTDVGVRVYAKGGIGKINARGLKSDDDAYVNDAYGKAEVTLRIDIEAGIGEINLEAREYII